MANIREIKSRIQSVRDTMKITNAMYMISSTKLRKARKSLALTEEYFFTLQDMISRIKCHEPDIENRYFDERPEISEEDKTRGIIVITADKGLAGAYNHNVLKLVQDQIARHKKTKLYVVGEIGRHSLAGKNIDIAEQFRYSAQDPSLHRARVISERVIAQFLEGELDEIYIAYTEMKNSMVCENRLMKLLPMSREVGEEEMQAAEDGDLEEMKFHPSPAGVIDNIVPDCVMGYIYGALVESFCSEQNERMMAMEAANRNAQIMIHDLSVQYNRERQAIITQEITEVIAGAKAQKKKKMQKKEA